MECNIFCTKAATHQNRKVLCLTGFLMVLQRYVFRDCVDPCPGRCPPDYSAGMSWPCPSSWICEWGNSKANEPAVMTVTAVTDTVTDTVMATVTDTEVTKAAEEVELRDVLGGSHRGLSATSDSRRLLGVSHRGIPATPEDFTVKPAVTVTEPADLATVTDTVTDNLSPRKFFRKADAQKALQEVKESTERLEKYLRKTYDFLPPKELTMTTTSSTTTPTVMATVTATVTESVVSKLAAEEEDLRDGLGVSHRGIPATSDFQPMKKVMLCLLFLTLFIIELFCRSTR